MPDQQMQEAEHMDNAKRRQLLSQVNHPAEKVTGGEHDYNCAENPQNQEFVFQRHGGPPTSVKAFRQVREFAGTEANVTP
jgi:hypothetical protein